LEFRIKWELKVHKYFLFFCTAWASRIELIQDFEFPEASIRVKTTRDGRYVMATGMNIIILFKKDFFNLFLMISLFLGVYKPQIRVYEFSEMSMKFDRHTDSENVNFVVRI